MKFFLNAFIFTICLYNANAQYVTITDPVFAGFLEYNYPACIVNNDQLDTNIAATYHIVSMNFGGENISNITGIKYFSRLKELILDYNHLITFIPELPDSIENLSLQGNYNLHQLPASLPTRLVRLNTSNTVFGSLPPLPGSLRFLNCEYNSLTAIPQLPQTLDTLNCNGNQIATLPPLPATMTYLDCWNNPISVLQLPDSLRYLDCNSTQQPLPQILPEKLEVLKCGYCQINVLPSLPPSLRILWCTYNNLSQLPVLPDSLTELLCQMNQLTGLPSLPAKLEKLLCGENLITSLPVLPPVLKTLWCNSNDLSGLPTLSDSLDELQCSDNPLMVLPNLPAGLKLLRCSSDHLSALPVLPAGLQELICNANQITQLPVIGTEIDYLNCSYNLLTSVPALPHKMWGIQINNNPDLRCAPLIDTLRSWNEDSINYSHTGIQCLPFHIVYQTIHAIPSIDNLPLCSVFNPDSCSMTIGIEELSSSNFDFFPNPGNDIITIKILAGTTITLNDQTGRLVYEKKFTTVNSQQSIEINISNLPAGVYVLSIHDERNSISRKFIKA